jgi:anti-sigma B factor antagonist
MAKSIELTSVDLPDGIRKIDLSGRLDIEGAGEIDLKFTVLMSAHQAFAVVDLSGVDFLASIGLATLVRGAKTARLRGGNMVLLNPQSNVAKVLASSRIDQVIPVCHDLDHALTVVRLGPSPLL